jgi:hypothetical protein
MEAFGPTSAEFLPLFANLRFPVSPDQLRRQEVTGPLLIKRSVSIDSAAAWVDRTQNWITRVRTSSEQAIAACMSPRTCLIGVTRALRLFFLSPELGNETQVASKQIK